MLVKAIKMHGQGNDYVFLDLEDSDYSVSTEQWRKLAVKLSNRKTGFGVDIVDVKKKLPKYLGVGSDGLVLIERMQQSMDIHHAKMRIFNADGSEAEACGTAQRCMAFYLHSKKNNSNICLHTASGKRLCTVEENGIVTTDMGLVRIEKKVSLFLNDHTIEGYEVHIGNPHFVVINSDVLNKEDDIWQVIGNHEAFPNRINVENVSVINKNTIKVRVWERGSGFTLACGSGACASAFVTHSEKKLNENINVKLPGGDVQVQIQLDNECFLTGKVEKVFETEIEI